MRRPLHPASVVRLEFPILSPRGGQVGADGEVFGVLEEALAGGILVQPESNPSVR